MKSPFESSGPLYSKLLEWFAGKKAVVVAFSGGVDSTLVLQAAVDALPASQVLAVIADSPSLARQELETAKELAKNFGAPLLSLATTELEDENYQKNAGDRCYFCKKNLYETLSKLLERLPEKLKGNSCYQHLDLVAFQTPTIVDGLNLDDLGDQRPGRKAAELFGVLHPLVEVGLTKSTVRELSRARGLPTHNKPEMACLASRIAVGIRVSKEKLSAVETVEGKLRELGFSHFRVRYHELAGLSDASPTKLCRLEFSEGEIERANDAELREIISNFARGAGFSFVTMDLDGYRKGGRPA